MNEKSVKNPDIERHRTKPGIMVLNNWNEVGEAIHFLSRNNNRTHRNPIKNWDLRLIAEMVNNLSRDELIIDLGASVLGVVRLLYEMGFKRIVGYDIKFSKFDRLLQFRDWLDFMARMRRIAAPPYRLRSKDLFETGLEDECASAVVCLSVIEHNVDQNKFFAEVARLLKSGGRLFVSTDYWEPKLDTAGRKMYGRPWNIFNRSEIEAIIEIAKSHGLSVDPQVPYDLSCKDAIVIDLGHSYTFISMHFFKI